MKRIYILICTCFLLLGSLSAQSGFGYQTVLRNNAGDPVVNQSVNVKFSIIQSTANGNVVYEEIHTATTNKNGFVQLTIGNGTVQLGNLSQIAWGEDTYFIKTELNNGTSYDFIGVQQLLSVPYALQAENAEGIQKKSADGTVWNVSVNNDGTLSTQKVEQNIIPIPNGYSKLVFSEEFNGAGLPDDSKWSFEEGYVRNGELQYYTVAREDNCFQEDGYLNIVCLNDSLFVENALISQWPDVRKDSVVPITSASIHTRGKAGFLYGKVEVRAKLPQCVGSWPAIWMMPVNDTYGYWPNSGEIDIMEHVGYEKNKVHYTLHCKEYNSGTPTNPRNYSVTCTTTDTEFHVYGIEWTEDRIEFYLDGQRKFFVNKTNESWTSWPFKHPFYMILNFGFGGGWGGQKGVDISALPQTYQIDYVRIFQK